MSFSQEGLQKLVDARIVTLRSADAVKRLVAGEKPEDIIVAMTKPRQPAPTSSSAPAGASAAAAAAPAAAKPAPRAHTGEPSKTTLFVANLPFAVDDAQLSKIFADHKPKEARVALRRDNRSRGYGFVTFENETDMQAAQKAVDKKTVQDREISVRVVLGDERKPPVRDTRGAPSGGIVGGPRAPRIPRAPRPAGEPSPTLTFFGNLPYTVDDAKLNGLLAGYKVATPAKVSLRHDGRSLGFALVNFESAAEQQKAIAALNNTQFEGRQIKVEQSSGHRTPRAPRVPHPPRTPLAGGEASKTTLFVANLPYIVDDAGLLQIFEGFQVKEAHVPRRRNGMSTGYGFVTLATEVESQRALKEVDKSLVEKREISVRPAFNRPAAAAGAAPAAAPAPATAQ